MENILDEQLAKNKVEASLLKVIQYWESRRRYFNVSVGLAGLLPSINFGWEKLVLFPIEILFFIFIYGLIANICYCLGWGIDVIKWYYLGDANFGKYKETLWILGLIFSIVLTLALTTALWIL